MSVDLSNRVQRIRPSPTITMTALAAELVQQGKDVIGLSAGEPDFETPKHAREVAIDAINSGDTKYTAVDGALDLGDAVAKNFIQKISSNTCSIKYWCIAAQNRFVITLVRPFWEKGMRL